MKRSLIASFAALSVIAAPAVAATMAPKAGANVTKSEKKQAKLAAKQQKAAPKMAAKAK